MMKNIFAFLLLFFSIGVFSQVNVSYPRAIIGDYYSSRYIPKFDKDYSEEKNKFRTVESLDIYAFPGDVITVTLGDKAVSKAEIPGGMKSDTLNVSPTVIKITAKEGPYKETFQFKQVYEDESLGECPLVELTINLSVTEEISAASVNAYADGIAFTINGTQRNAYMTSGEGSFSYAGRNKIVGNITESCDPQVTIDNFSPTETANTEYVSDLTHQSPWDYKFISFSNGSWVKVSTEKIKPITVIEVRDEYDQTYPHYKRYLPEGVDSMDVYLDWNGYKCFDSLLVIDGKDFSIIGDTIVDALDSVNTDTCRNLPIGDYYVDAHDGVSWRTIYRFVVDSLPPEPPKGINCESDFSFSASYTCLGESSSIEISNINVADSVEVSGMTSSMSAPFPFGVDLEKNGEEYTIPDNFSFFESMGGEDISVSLSVTDSYGKTCTEAENAEYTDPTASGSVFIERDCWGMVFYGSTDIVVEEGSYCGTTEYTIAGVDPNDHQSISDFFPVDPYGGSGGSLSILDKEGKVIGDVDVSFLDYIYYPYINSFNGPASILEGEDYVLSISAFDADEVRVTDNSTWDSESVSSEFGDDFSYNKSLTPGPYSFSLVAESFMCPFPLTSPSEFAYVDVINVDPTVSIVSPGAEEYSDGDIVIVEVEAYDPGEVTSVDLEYNGMSFPLNYNGSTYSGTITADALAFDQTITVNAYDDFDGFGTTSTSLNLGEQQDSLYITNVSPGNNFVFNVGDPIDVSYEVTDPFRLYSGSINYNGEEVNSNNFTSFIAEGSGFQEISIFIETDDGQTDGYTIMIEVLNAPPLVEIVTPFDGSEFELNDPIPFDYSIDLEDDETVILLAFFNGQVVDLLSETPNFVAENAGEYSIEIYAEDADGNPNRDVITVTIKDPSIITPEVLFVGITDGEEVTVGDMINVGIETSGDIDESSILLIYDGVSYPIESGFEIPLTAVGSGEQSIELSFKDVDGTPYSKTVLIMVNNQPPMVVINSPVNSEEVILNSEIVIDYDLDAVDDEIISFVAIIDGRSYDLLNGETPVAPSQEGDYEIAFIAKDNSGLETEKIVNVTVVEQPSLIDGISLTGLTDGEIYNTGESLSAIFEIDGEVDLSTIQVFYEGEEIEVTGGPLFDFELDLLGEGEQVITVQMKDLNGLPFTKKYVINVINTKPVVEIVEPESLITMFLGDSIPVEIAISDDEENIQSSTVSFDGVDYDWLTDERDYLTPTSTGVKTLLVKVVDEVGAYTTKEVTVIVNEKEIQLPEVTIVSPVVQSLTDEAKNLLIDVDIEDPENGIIENVTLIFVDVNDPESLVYKKEITEEPYELSFDDLDFFPWAEGTIGMQVLVSTEDGRSASAFSEFDIEIENEFELSIVEGEEFDLMVYPIPSFGDLNISLNTAANYAITDLKGVLVKEGFINKRKTLDLQALPGGVYILEILVGNDVMIKKINIL